MQIMRVLKMILSGLPKMALLWLLVGLLFLGACGRQNIVRGNLIRPSQIEELNIGKSKNDDVLRVLGSPTTVSIFDDSLWYYIGQRRTQSTFYPPKMETSEVYVFDFDAEGILRDMRYYDRDSLISVAYSAARTPTRGSELTVVQQLFGNLGRFEATPGQGGARELLKQ